MECVLLVFLLGVASAGVVETNNNLESIDNELVNTELVNTDLVQAFVVFRHGDRTPDQEELDLLSSGNQYHDAISPYGMKALTNRGKQCGYKVGEYLRRRYRGFISELYVPDEISVRTTDYDRTKMTALTAMAALYPPPPSQRWHPTLNWQPVPYDTLPYEEDDLLYWYNCPRYLWLRNKMYESPKVVDRLKKYQSLFHYLSKKTNMHINTTENVFYLDNLFQTLQNVNATLPKWVENKWPLIKNVTKEEYNIDFYNTELIKLAAGVVMNDILNASRAAMSGLARRKLWLHSAHENNVAAVMAAAGVFTPHQPSYGSTFSLELRRNRSTNHYGVLAVYLADPCSTNASHTEQILSIKGCSPNSGTQMCDFKEFANLVREYEWSYGEFRQQCELTE